MKGLSIRESIECRDHARRKIDRFTQTDGESLSQAWGKFVEILSASQIFPYSDPELFQYFTTKLNGSTLEFLRRMHVSKFDDLQWAAALNAVLDEARSTGSLTFAAGDPSDRDFLEFVFANVSEAGDIDGVYISREGDLLHLRTSTTPAIETLQLPTEDEYLATLGTIVDVVRSTGSLRIVAGDASDRNFHTFIMHRISSAGTIDDGVYARVMGDKIHFYTVSPIGTCEGNNNIVVPQPSLIPDLPPQPEPTKPLEPIVERTMPHCQAPLSFFEAEDPAPEIIAPTQGESFTTFLFTFDTPPLFDDYPIFDIDVTDSPLVLQENCIHDQVVHWDTYEENIEELPAADACDNDLQVVWDESESETDELPVLWDEPPTEELNENFINLPEEPEKSNQELVEMVFEDMDEISGKCCQPNLNLIIYVDDLLWENFMIGQKSSHQVFAACFSQLIGGLLWEMLEAALLGLVGVCGAVHLAEPRKVQIEQLDAPLKIPDPPFLLVSLIQ